MEDQEKKPIDAEIIEDEKEGSKDEEQNSKRKIDFRFELALFLILGFLLGVVIKTEAVKRITIGFNDSAIPSLKQSYDFEKIKEELEEKISAQQAAPSQNAESASGEQAPSEGSQGNNQ